MTIRQGIDNLVETETHNSEVEKILVDIIGKIIEGDHETISGMIIEETITESRGTEVGMEVETIAGILMAREKILGMTFCEVEISVEIEVGQDNHILNLEEKREGTEIGQCQDQG